ncbi:hypothetical protein FHS27_001202 [Rhodopirellula rubra]|uniref:Uncharacterized protein n=1 Tax=Aporhodopirellula rubra TaxID=980271 RepID=A0A7W5H3K7_9BACT|nr:hypothetical protein [Aporhodopirellula rubra]MBB3205402.1 hypothetical protein [Aporhodopirellula rubra]
MFDEIATLFASAPSADTVLQFRPSSASVDRASELLELNRRGTLDDAAREELNQLEFAELLMQSVKARIRRKTTETKSSP